MFELRTDLMTKLNACLVVLMMAAVTAGAGESAGQRQFSEYKDAVLQDPSLIRFYTFEDGHGNEVTNHVVLDPSQTASTGGPLGSLTIGRRSVDDQAPNVHVLTGSVLPGKLISPDWTRGRWPWKAAISSGLDRATAPPAASKLYRSGITGADFSDGGTLTGWIRIHENAEAQESCNIVTLGDGWGNGFILSWSKNAQTPKGSLSFKMGAAEATLRGTQVATSPCQPAVWHQFAVAFDGATLKLYLDGALKDEKPFAAKVVPTSYEDYPQVGPFYENLSPTRWGSFLMIAHNVAQMGKVSSQFDIDELAIYKRALTADEIGKLELAGRPSMTPSEQLADYRALMSGQKTRDEIRMDIPYDTGGYFRIDQPIAATVDIPAETGLQGDFTAVFELETIYGKPVRKLERKVSVGKPLTESLLLPECGAYLLDMSLVAPDGALLKRLSRKYGLGIVPPAPKELTKNNPVAFWANLDDRFSYDAPIRRVLYLNAADFETRYAGYEKVIPNFRAFAWFYCGMTLEPKVLAKNKTLFAEAVKTMQDKKVFGLEVTSEPKVTEIKGYVEMLRMVTEAFRPEMPDLLIFPPGGSPPQIPMIAEILKQGGIKYVDGVSYHPYTGHPIYSHLWDNPTKRLREVVALYPEKKLTLWATENALNSLPRVRDRPMTREQAHGARYPSFLVDGLQGFSSFVSMTPEDDAAALQCHDILLKLVDGYEIYTIHMTPNVSLARQEGGELPSLKGVAITALAGQVLNTQKEVTRLPLAAVENMCVLVRHTDGSTTAAIFSMKPATISFKVAPNAEFRSMDMLGNFGVIKANAEGLITVQSGMAPFYIFGVPDKLQEVTPLKIVAPVVLPDNGILKGTVTVSNPFSTPLTATLAAQKVPGAGITLKKTAISLAAGDSATIPIELRSESLKRRSYLLGVAMTGTDGKVIATAQQIFESQGVIQVVPQAATPIKLDGDPADWANIPAVICNDAESVVHGKPNRAEIWVPQWMNEEDLSLSIQTAWRKGDGIYFLLKVRDNVLLPAPADKVELAFRYDCLEFFFDSREKASQGTVISAGADQAIVIPQIGEQAAPCELWYGKKGQNHITLECVGRKTEDGYLIEGRVTPNAKSTFQLQDGAEFRMDFLVDDTDKLDPKWLRKAAMALHGKMSNYDNSNIWGRYKLSLEQK